MNTENHDESKASFDGQRLEALTQRIRRLFDIKDRTYGFPPKTYPDCFVGKEAVSQLVKEGIASDADDAVHIGNMLLNAGVFHHVLDEHTFKNEKLFYRFIADEDHGRVARKPDGSAVSWSDFIAPLTNPKDGLLSLQPDIPECWWKLQRGNGHLNSTRS